MENELYSLLKEFVNEFDKHKSEITHNPKINHAFKSGIHTNEGARRGSGHSIHYGVCLDLSSFYQQLSWVIYKFKSSKKIYDFVVKYRLWHTEYDSYQSCMQHVPSMIGCIAGGFLCRNFEINNC